MATAAILPIKRFEAAKQRLGEALGVKTRAALAAALLDDVLAQLRQARSVDMIVVVSGEPAVRELATGHDAMLTAPQPLVELLLELGGFAEPL